MAWGSGTANFPYLITPDSALQAQAIVDGTVYQSVFGMWVFERIFIFALGANSNVFPLMHIDGRSARFEVL